MLAICHSTFLCAICRNKEAQDELRKKLLAHKEIDAKVRTLREQAQELKGQYDKTEDDLKALQSIGQIIGEVLRQLDDERCEPARCCPLTCLVARPAAAATLHLFSPAGSADVLLVETDGRMTSCWRHALCLGIGLRGCGRSPECSRRLRVPCSHRQGQQRPALRGGLQSQGG